MKMAGRVINHNALVASSGKRGKVCAQPAQMARPHLASFTHRVSQRAPFCLAAKTDDELDLEEAAVDGPLAQPSTSYEVPADDADSRELAVAIARICWETKGEDVLALHVAPLVYWTRYMVMATVFSRPQLNAILGKVEKEALESFDRRPASPASGRSAWELLDYGDVVVHVMTADQREYYDLENFYGAADEVDLPFLKEANDKPLWETKM